MQQTPEFKKLLNKCIILLIQETKDGCIDCTDDGPCIEHQTFIDDLIIHPGKYITIKKVKGKLQASFMNLM